jgi:hypothetical protein
MPLHKDDAVSFETPPDWEDRSIVAFQAPSPVGEARGVPNVMLTREPMRETDTLRTHAERRLFEVGRSLSNFEVLECRDVEVGGCVAVLMRFAWTTPQGALEQTFTFVEAAQKPRGVFLFVATSPREQATLTRDIFERLLASVVFPHGTRPAASVRVPKGAPAQEEAPLPFIPMPGVRMASGRS